MANLGRASGALMTVLALAVAPAGVPVAAQAPASVATSGGGPRGAAAAWVQVGPAGGAAEAVAFCSAQPGVVYAGTVWGGVFRSQDGGAAWAPAGAGLPSQGVVDLAVSPEDCAVAYAATVSPLTLIGAVSLTRDGGVSWQDASVGLEGAAAGAAFVLDPRHPSTLYALTGSGLFRTRFGQSAWAPVWRVEQIGLPSTVFVAAVAVDPLASSTFYAAMIDGIDGLLGKQGGVYRSTDGGRTWAAVNGGRRGIFGTQSSARLRFDRAAPSTLYLLSSFSLWKTADGGGSWTEVKGPWFYLRSFAVGPQGVIYAMAIGSGGPIEGGPTLYLSRDHGATWQAPADDGPADLISDLVVAPGDPSRLLAIGQFGLWGSADGGDSWRTANRGLVAQLIADLSPAADGSLYVGVGAGVFHASREGAAWKRLGRIGGDFVIADPHRPQTLYSDALSALGGPAPARSDDGGSHWTSINLPDDRGALVVDPANSQTLYSIRPADTGNDFSCNVFKSFNSGKRWSCIGDGGTGNGFTALLIDPRQPATLYGFDGYDLLERSEDGGGTWVAASQGLPAGLSAVVLDPSRPHWLYMASQQGLFHSTDQGRSWQLLSPSLPRGVQRLVVDPRASSRLFASVPGTGVFGSADGGVTWTALGQGLPAGLFTAGRFELDPLLPQVTLYAGTWGLGVYRLDLDLDLAPSATAP